MGKAVILTRKAGDKVIVEGCILVSDDDLVYTMDNQPLTVVSPDDHSKVLGNTVSDISGGLVMFEDRFGLFGIRPEDIVKIEVV